MNRRRKVHPIEIRQHSSEARLSDSIGSNCDETGNCRFCRGAIADQQNKAIPCECSTPIHLTCLKEEMGFALRGQLLSSHRVSKYPCGKCKCLIRFQNKETVHCRSYDELLAFRKSNLALCSWLAIGSILTLLLLIFLIVLITHPQMITPAASYTSVLMGTAIAIGVLLIMLTFFCCLSVLIQRSSQIRMLPTISSRKKSTGIEIIEYP